MEREIKSRGIGVFEKINKEKQNQKIKFNNNNKNNI